MYADFYGFTEHPFNITPDPRFLYLTPAHKEALAALNYGIREKKSFVVLTGEVGTGKTTLLYHLVDHLAENVKTAFIFHTHTTFKQVLKSIFLELELPLRDEDTVLLISRLNHYLIERAVAGETVVLIIDEAQNLSTEVLEDIRLLSNLETRSAKLLQIVLCGQPELEAKINTMGLRQLRQRIEIQRRIGPLSELECWDYVEHRLKIVGGNAGKLFTPGAMSLLWAHSRRIPRLINMMCDNALLIGYATSRKKIDQTIMHEVIRGLDGALSSSTSLAVSEPVLPSSTREKIDTLRKLLSAVAARRTL